MLKLLFIFGSGRSHPRACPASISVLLLFLLIGVVVIQHICLLVVKLLLLDLRFHRGPVVLALLISTFDLLADVDIVNGLRVLLNRLAITLRHGRHLVRLHCHLQVRSLIMEDPVLRSTIRYSHVRTVYLQDPLAFLHHQGSIHESILAA